MIDILTIVGGLLIGGLGFTAKFIGSLCLILIAMIAFIILFIFLIGLGWVIGTCLLEIARDKRSIFDKEVTEYEERNNNNCNG